MCNYTDCAVSLPTSSERLIVVVVVVVVIVISTRIILVIDDVMIDRCVHRVRVRSYNPSLTS